MCTVELPAAPCIHGHIKYTQWQMDNELLDNNAVLESVRIGWGQSSNGLHLQNWGLSRRSGHDGDDG